MEYDGDFRHCMGCQGCWAFTYSIDEGFTCRIDMFDKNRPDGISPDRLRFEFSVYESALLATWKCEYRYTRQEVETMKNGGFRDVHVSLGHAAKVLKMVKSLSA